MTLLIAWMIIAGCELNPVLYIISFGVYLMSSNETVYQDEGNKKR